MMTSFPESLSMTVRCLQEQLAEDLKILDVRDVSTVTDYFVIATGNSTPHLRAMAETLDRTRKAEGMKDVRKTGGTGSGWMVRDFHEVIVHLMSSELREFYALEKLWSDGKTVSVTDVSG